MKSKITNILEQLDALFEEHKFQNAEMFIIKEIKKAEHHGEWEIKITLLNELIGLYRDLGKYEDVKLNTVGLKKLIDDKLDPNGFPYATTLINIGNALRAAGVYDESLDSYKKAQMIYEKILEEDNISFAGLYNNFSLLYQEMGDFEKSAEYLFRSLNCINCYTEARIEKATTLSNLSMSLAHINRLSEAEEMADRSLEIFEEGKPYDFHYSGALSAKAHVYFQKKDFENAGKFFLQAMEFHKSILGETETYNRLKENYKLAVNKSSRNEDSSLKGLEISRIFYETFFKSRFETEFAKIASAVSIGLAGEGSECLGLDDEISRDHDFDPGFCIWIPDDLDKEWRLKLEELYSSLPNEFMGLKRNTIDPKRKRRGVFTISEFLLQTIGITHLPQNPAEWITIPSWKFLNLINGELFTNTTTDFTKIRKDLATGYPENIRRERLAEELTFMAQTGQYNYNRLKKRNEDVAAWLVYHEFIQHCISFLFLINNKYEPIKKWALIQIRDLKILPEIGDIICALYDMTNQDERIQPTIEIIAQLITAELHAQGLTSSKDPYLEQQALDLLEENVLKVSEKKIHLNRKKNMEQLNKNELIQELVLTEWEAFDQVKNIGGRADCQDDWNTFEIMRKSQYECWNSQMLRSLLLDFETAKEEHRNLITEKYGFMMESTDKSEYNKIKNQLPEIGEWKKNVIEEIIKIQVQWMKEFSINYPKTANNARSIESSQDSMYNTSYETYLRGELKSYSDETIKLYLEFIIDLVKKNENLAKRIMEHTAKAYGYQNLEQLETLI